MAALRTALDDGGRWEGDNAREFTGADSEASVRLQWTKFEQATGRHMAECWLGCLERPAYISQGGQSRSSPTLALDPSSPTAAATGGSRFRVSKICGVPKLGTHEIFGPRNFPVPSTPRRIRQLLVPTIHGTSSQNGKCATMN